MAVIGKIQKNSYLLLIVIGLAMLAFIFTDSFKNFGGGVEPLPSGEISGVEINEAELNDQENDLIEKDRQNFGFQQKEYTTEDEQNSKDQAFNEIIRRSLMEKQLGDLGLSVSSAELNDMITGKHVHPWVSEVGMFKNSIGEFSRDSVSKYLTGLQSSPDPLDTARVNRWREAKLVWSQFEKELQAARSTDKFVSLIKKGIFVNSLELKDAYIANGETRDISFVMQPYNSITEDEVNFTDEDIKAYYQKHKNDKLYNQPAESAEIQYVEFPVAYSQEDLNLLKAEMNNLKSDFSETTNNIYLMATKGEDKFYSDTTAFEVGTTEELVINDQSKAYQYPESIDSMIQLSKEGDVIGPFESTTADGKLQIAIAKVTGFETEKRATVRHILISTNDREVSEAKSLADSIIRVIKAKDNFVEMVNQFTDDPGSKNNGGVYKWFKQGTMVPEFDKASFEGAKGVLQLVKTTYGYHIVEVIDRQDRKLPKLAPIRKTVKPGVETIQLVENTAYEFINDVEVMKDDSAFFKTALLNNLLPNNSKLFLSTRFVTGFKNHEKIQKFAFSLDSEEGDISTPILDDSKIKVAYLKNKTEKGVPTFETVKNQMKTPALREKQFEHYSKLMSGTNNINEVAQNVPNGKVQQGTVTFAAASISGVSGKENAVVGAIFSLEKEAEGAMLKPLKGETGVFVVVLDKVNEVEIPEDYDFSSERLAAVNTRVANADGNVMKALRDKANIVDNRLKKSAQGR